VPSDEQWPALSIRVHVEPSEVNFRPKPMVHQPPPGITYFAPPQYGEQSSWRPVQETGSVVSNGSIVTGTVASRIAGSVRACSSEPT
jgi:hypothetical protein